MGSIARTIGYADTTAPTAPTLSLTAQGTDALLASWTPATDTGTGVRYYRLYVGTTAGTLALTETFSRATTAWLISGLPAQSTRYARVEAVDGAGNVSSSAVVSGTTQAQGTGGALAFAQPNPVSYSPGQSVSLALSQYVTGGGATKFYHRMSGSLPGDLSLATATGAITGTARQSGPYAPVIRVTDTIADALEADWVARSTGPGVQWAHDFRSDAEVSKFASLIETSPGVWGPQIDASSNPLTRRITSDGITGGGCMELYTPFGAHNNMGWWRPFACLPGDLGYQAGRDTDIPPAWTSTGRWNWVRGLYGHRDYHIDNLGVGYNGALWDGSDFYIQFRAKISSTQWSLTADPNTSNPDGGKFVFIDLASGGNQELVLQCPFWYGTHAFGMYTAYGNSLNSKLNANQNFETEGNYQPGGAFASTCVYGNYDGGCWLWPTDRWFTMLVHVTPGHHNGDANGADPAAPDAYRDTGIEVWVADYGDTSYTKIWEKLDYVWNWRASGAAPQVCGFNVFAPSSYMNGAMANGAAFYRRFSQVIFSKQLIPCPRVYA